MISENTDSCIYYSEGEDDTLKRLIRYAMESVTGSIVEYSLKMAVTDGTKAVMTSTIAMLSM